MRFGFQPSYYEMREREKEKTLRIVKRHIKMCINQRADEMRNSPVETSDDVYIRAFHG